MHVLVEEIKSPPNVRVVVLQPMKHDPTSWMKTVECNKLDGKSCCVSYIQFLVTLKSRLFDLFSLNYANELLGSYVTCIFTM